MSIAAKCDLCGTELEVDDRLAGNLAQCPKCKQDVLIPTPNTGPVRVSARSSTDTLRRAMGSDHGSRIQGSRKVAGYFNTLGLLSLLFCGAGAVFAIIAESIGLALVLVGTGIFNFFLWQAVHYGLHLLADIEENTRLLK